MQRCLFANRKRDYILNQIYREIAIVLADALSKKENTNHDISYFLGISQGRGIPVMLCCHKYHDDVLIDSLSVNFLSIDRNLTNATKLKEALQIINADDPFNEISSPDINQYTATIICIKGCGGFVENKIYEVIDGTLYDDGEQISKPNIFTNINDLNSRISAEFAEIEAGFYLGLFE